MNDYKRRKGVNNDLERIKEAIKEKIDQGELAVVEDIGNGPYEHFGGTGNDVDMRLIVYPGTVEVQILDEDDFWVKPIVDIEVHYKHEGRGKECEAIIKAELEEFKWRPKENKCFATYNW